MAKKLSVANGTYTAQDGSTKTKWVSVGVILEKDGKEYMLIDPTINFAGFPREQGQQQQYNQPQQNNYNAPQQQQQ